MSKNHDKPDLDADEQLDAELELLANSVPVSAVDPSAPRLRAEKRTRNVRVVVGSTLGAALLFGGLQLAQRDTSSVEVVAVDTTLANAQSDGTVGTSRAAGSGSSASVAINNSGSVVFSQRTVDGDVKFAEWSTTADDGTIYALSTAPGTRAWNYEDGSPPQAIYSSTDGEHWSAVELGDRRISRLTASNGLLYGLSSSETSNGDVRYSLASSTDGGGSWNDSPIPLALDTPDGPAYANATPYVNIDLAVTDTAYLASVQTTWSIDEGWLFEQFGVAFQEGIWTEFSETGVLIRDSSACNAAEQELSDIYTMARTDALEGGATQEEAERDASAALDGIDEELMYDACEDPPVIAEKTFAELGLDGSANGIGESYGLRSIDGVSWERVALPGQWLSVVGDQFVAYKWGETETVHFSDDGLNWSAGSQPYGWASEGMGEIAGQLGAFRFVSGYEMDEIQASVENRAADRLFFGTSTDGSVWTESLIFESEPGLTESWPAVQTVGPLGAFVVIQSQDISLYEDDEAGVQVGTTVATTVVEAVDFSYQDYLASLSYEVRYSIDGVNWQTIELVDPPQGHLSWAYMSNDSIGLSFTVPSQTSGELGKVVTLLLTPER